MWVSNKKNEAKGLASFCGYGTILVGPTMLLEIKMVLSAELAQQGKWMLMGSQTTHHD
jgi:hypothetical protein